MVETGLAFLYITTEGEGSPELGRKSQRWHSGYVSNWPGTLKFPARGCGVRVRKNAHNWGLTRSDIWFNGPDGFKWHGVSYGDYTQLTRCTRTRERWAKPKG